MAPSSLPSTSLVDFSAHYCPFWYTTPFLLLLSVYFECHKSSQILSLLSVNKLLGFGEIYRKQRPSVSKCSKSISLVKLIQSSKHTYPEFRTELSAFSRY